MSPPARRSIARIHDVDLHWTEVGEGRPLVLLHGLTDSHLTWSHVGPKFAATHRVLAPDLAGHGLSGRPDASYSLAWHAEVIGAWLDALGLDDIDLVGHSFGGGVAQWLVLTHAARIRRLGLVAAGGLGREVSLALRLCSLPGVVEQLGQPFMRLGTRLGIAAAGCAYSPDELDALCRMNDRPGSARALARTVRDVIGLGGQHRHFLDRAGEVESLPPIAVFWGDRDPVIPIEHGRRAASFLEGVVLTRFEDCGHFPHRERPGPFATALRDFVDAPSHPRATLRRTLLVASKRPRRSLWRRALERARGWLRWRRPRPPAHGPEAAAVAGTLRAGVPGPSSSEDVTGAPTGR